MSFYTWILIDVVCWTFLGAFFTRLMLESNCHEFSRKEYVFWITFGWIILFGFCLIAFFQDQWKHEELSIKLNPWLFMDKFALWLKN